MTILTKGGNVPVPAEMLTLTLSWQRVPGAPGVDISALVLGENGKVGSDADMVFFNAPRHGSGAVELDGSGSGVRVNVAALPPHVDKVVIAGSSDGGAFGSVPGLTLSVTGSNGVVLASFTDMGATTETALVAGELYRRAGAWKFRAVGQGWASGLSGLATDYGITVDDAPAAPPTPPPPAYSPPPRPAQTYAPTPPAPTSSYAPPPPPAPAYAPPPAPAAAPAMVNLDKGRVSLRKGEKVSLTKTGAPSLTLVTMGLGWDPARWGKDIDLDASVITYDANARALEAVYFNHLNAYNRAIHHCGDNLTGAGDGDDEQIQIDLSAIPSEVAHLVFTINSYKGHKFTEVKNAFCRLVDGRTGAELVRFNLTDSERETGVVMATISRDRAGSWVMTAIGRFAKGRTVRDMLTIGSQVLPRL